MKFNKLIPEFTVADFQKSLDFYIKIIGFKIEYRREKPKFAFLSFDGSQIMIQEQEKKDKWEVGKMEHPYGRGINFQIDVSDIQKISEQIMKNNYPVFQKLKENSYRENSIVHREIEILIQDPDGYLLRFSQYIKE
jgi:catechol 2,3-dioxygenase-like lactoylglutathione lyase family enzyme